MAALGSPREISRDGKARATLLVINFPITPLELTKVIRIRAKGRKIQDGTSNEGGERETCSLASNYFATRRISVTVAFELISSIPTRVMGLRPESKLVSLSRGSFLVGALDRFNRPKVIVEKSFNFGV